MLKKLNFEIIIEIIALIFLLCLPLLIIDQNIRYITTAFGLCQYLHFCLIFTSIYFLNTFYLFPVLYNKSHHSLYILSLLAILTLVLWQKPFDKFINQKQNFLSHDFQIDQPVSHPNQPLILPIDRRPLKPRLKNGDGHNGPGIDVVSVFIYFLTIIISFTKETNKQLNLSRQRALVAESEKTQAQLSFLKAQVNPHFLFNTLNNIYTLAIINDRNTAPSIMKLSNIMRYITDEAGNDFVSLRKELDCIVDFIDLQKLRLTQKTTLFFEVEGDCEQQKIAPLILMAFVENAFKYGISNHRSNKLVVKIFCGQKSLILFCQNTIHPDKTKIERSGIGLENTRRRLNYIYKDMHVLNVDHNINWYTVNLTIRL